MSVIPIADWIQYGALGILGIIMLAGVGIIRNLQNQLNQQWKELLAVIKENTKSNQAVADKLDHLEDRDHPPGDRPSA